MSTVEITRALFAVVSQHPLLERLLLASLEFAALALLMMGVIWVCRIKWPRLTAMLWLLVLAKPLVSLAIGSPLCLVRITLPEATAAMRPIATPLSEQQPARDDLRSALSLGEVQSEGVLSEKTVADAPAGNPAHGSSPSRTKTLLGWLKFNAAGILAGLWIAGALFFAGLAVADRCRRWRLVASAKAPGHALSARYVATASSLDIRRIPRLVVTDELESPALAGVISPVILIPTWLAREHTSARLDWALKHELMHWKLLDPLAGFVRELAQTLFYFHPAAWWAGRKWEEAAELACDRAIVASQADSHDYAEQLYQILVKIRDHRRLRLNTGLFATRTQIGRRIAALLEAPLATPPGLSALAIVLVVAFSAVTLSAGVGFAERTTEPSPASSSAAVSVPSDQQQNEKAAPAEQKPAEQIVVTGQVVDPEGKPVANATLWLEYKRLTQPSAEQGPRYSTTSGPDGEFRFNVPKAELAKQSRDDYWNSARVVAVARGFGFDEASASKELAAKPLTLQLVKDVPIRGRILDIEGRPVAGASVRVNDIRWTPGKSLDAFLAESRDSRALFRFGKYSTGPAELSEQVTGPDGRFTLTGVGEERFLRLGVAGPTIEHANIEVVTRDLAAGPSVGGDPANSKRLYGASFEHLAAPSRPIIGTVRDAVTRQPVAGATIHGSTSHIPKTDEAGRYQLLGYPKSPKYYLQVFPPEGQPYFRASVTIDDSPGLAPLEKDIELSALTIARGRVIDKRTGRPVEGRVEYHALYPNAYVARLDRVGRPASQATINSHGQFAISVFPGPGVLAFQVDALDKRGYQPAFVSADELKTLFKGNKDVEYDATHLTIAMGGTARSVIGQGQYQALVLINPEESQPALTADVVLESAGSVRGTVLDADGQPLAGATAEGLTPQSHFLSETLKTAEFESFGARPERPVTVLFLHEAKKLGAAIAIRGDETELSVRLQPLGSATGRLLTNDGEPAADITLDFNRSRFYGSGIMAKTDQDGRFRVDGLAAGQNYDATLRDGQQGIVKIVYSSVTIAPAQTTDLGDAKLR